MKELVAWTSETIIPGQVYGRYTVIIPTRLTGLTTTALFASVVAGVLRASFPLVDLGMERQRVAGVTIKK